jgi:hypothetical protein
MTRIFAFLALLLALVALAMPSLAAGSRGLASHPAPLVLVQPGAHLKAPCALGSFGRLLACRSDLGVLPGLALPQHEAAAPVHVPAADPMGDSRDVLPGLPPPKTA